MKVAHFSTTDRTGGATRAALRLHQGLLNRGVESKMVVRFKESDDPEIVDAGTSLGRLSNLCSGRARAKINRSFRGGAWEFFSTLHDPWIGSLRRFVGDADVVHVHWASEFIDLKKLMRDFHPTTPIVWTLHDMNLLTGGCHYTAGCQRYLQQCGHCPALGSNRQHDLSHKTWMRKNRIFSGLESKRIRIVGDSHWLASCAKQSPMLGRFDPTTIHYGLDQQVYSPGSKAKAREEFGIAPEKKVIVFCAARLDQPRKGFGILADAITLLRDIPNLHLLAIGQEYPCSLDGIGITLTGTLRDDHRLADAYRCGDVFVIPSTQEAFGLVTLEAMACGVPSVGFAVGGIVDLIKHEQNSLLVTEIAPEPLAMAIRRLLVDDILAERLAAAARQTVVDSHTLDHQASRYERLYQQMIAGDHAPS